MADAKEFFNDFQTKMGKVKDITPDTTAGFGGLFGKVMKDGAITLLEKELIAVAISVSQKCTPCIRLHVKKSLEAGATKEQILEACGVAVMMGGGPAYTHLAVVIETLEALEQ
ncbi:MAG: carboxymuconolactone decarboxylase family protein [Phycisphaerae bacterium]|nr:carboxymuconolactone decarboxylase family protein [Phycisphaerae bacterium]